MSLKIAKKIVTVLCWVLPAMLISLLAAHVSGLLAFLALSVYIPWVFILVPVLESQDYCLHWFFEIRKGK